MKSKTVTILMLLSGITLSVFLASPIRPAAQDHPQRAELAGKQGTSTNPVPLINQPLVPDAVAPGGPEFILTVNGTGFVPGSVVDWNGSALATTLVSASQLTATVPASDIANAGTASVTVVNPGPGGGGSNIIFFEVTPSSASVTMTTSSLSAGSGPRSVVTAEFNGDGILDLAVANSYGNNVSIFSGNGDGTFQAPVSYTVGSVPTSGMAAADLNGDGSLDLVVANNGSNNVSVMLGNGDGTFQTAVNHEVGTAPTWVAVGDFNHDGKLDLAASDQNCPSGNPCPTGLVSILLGNGDGTFQPQVEYDAGNAPNGLAVGDFNGDGNVDLAVANGQNESGASTVSILLGNGAGAFQAPVSYPTGINSASVATADFNKDGRLDLAVVNNIGSVSILLGNGDGTFQPQVAYTTGSFPWGNLGIADFNGDENLDFAVANSGSVQIFLGNGNGTFQSPLQFSTGSVPQGATPGDFEQDGRLGLAVPNVSGDTVSVLLQVIGPLAVLSPTSLNFGTQLMRTASSSQTVTLSNTGIATLEITSIAASPNFVEGNTCGSSLAAGARCRILVRFRPSGVGTETGTLTVTDNAPDSPQTASLTGVGTVVTLSPPSLNFSKKAVGTTSSAKTVTFTNSARTALRISGVRITGPDSGDFAQINTCGSSVAAGSSCTFSVTFTPGATGSRTATLNIGDNGGGSPQVVALSGTGT